MLVNKVAKLNSSGELFPEIASQRFLLLRFLLPRAAHEILQLLPARTFIHLVDAETADRGSHWGVGGFRLTFERICYIE